jgi:hypothetical protein
MRVMDSWFDRLPTFRLAGDPNDGMPPWVGNIFSLERLHFAW